MILHIEVKESDMTRIKEQAKRLIQKTKDIGFDVEVGGLLFDLLKGCGIPAGEIIALSGDSSNSAPFSMNTWDQWHAHTLKYFNNKTLRRGQIFMLALNDVDPVLYASFVAKPWDCFYNDSYCEEFLAQLRDIWGLA